MQIPISSVECELTNNGGSERVGYKIIDIHTGEEAVMALKSTLDRYWDMESTLRHWKVLQFSYRTRERLLRSNCNR